MDKMFGIFTNNIITNQGFVFFWRNSWTRSDLLLYLRFSDGQKSYLKIYDLTYLIRCTTEKKRPLVSFKIYLKNILAQDKNLMVLDLVTQFGNILCG